MIYNFKLWEAFMINLGLNAGDVANIREQIHMLEYKMYDEKKRAQSRLNNGDINLEKSGKGFYCDDVFDHNRRYLLEDKKKLEKLKDNLLSKNYCNHAKYDGCIRIGSSFSVCFLDSDCEEQFKIVNTLDGKSSLNGYISIDSPFAQSVLGKREGEDFSYVVSEKEVQGRVTQVQVMEEVHFLRNRVGKENVFKNNASSSSFIITPSQLELLKEYEHKIRRMISTFDTKVLLFYIQEIINCTSIISEPSFVKNNVNRKIGYGTSFSVMIYAQEKIINQRLEMIHQAFSTETTKEYIERISTLGNSIYGLLENEQFFVPNLGISGLVYDVDNSYYEERFVTNDPLVYQKRKM